MIYSGCVALVTALLLTSSGHVDGADAVWHYEGEHGPEHWSADYPFCGANHQSPIDINPDTAVYNSNLSEFSFHGYDTVFSASEFDIQNNGHTVQVVLANTNTIGVSGGGFSHNYTLGQFHFHWGEENESGSEHKINGTSYPLEIHIVHFSGRNFSDLKSEAGSANGDLAVLGVFAEISEQNNSAFATIIQTFEEIRLSGFWKYNMSTFPVRSLLPNNTADFYRYQGSLTTPPCYETVTWTVFREPLAISFSQLQAFREALISNDSVEAVQLVNNFRPIQPLNNRTVFKSFLSEEAATTTVSTPIVTPNNTVPIIVGTVVGLAAPAVFIIIVIRVWSADENQKRRQMQFYNQTYATDPNFNPLPADRSGPQISYTNISELDRGATCETPT